MSFPRRWCYKFTVLICFRFLFRLNHINSVDRLSTLTQTVYKKTLLIFQYVTHPLQGTVYVCVISLSIYSEILLRLYYRLRQKPVGQVKCQDSLFLLLTSSVGEYRFPEVQPLRPTRGFVRLILTPRVNPREVIRSSLFTLRFVTKHRMIPLSTKFLVSIP